MAALGAPLHEGRKAIRSRDRSDRFAPDRRGSLGTWWHGSRATNPAGDPLNGSRGSCYKRPVDTQGSGPTFREDQP